MPKEFFERKIALPNIHSRYKVIGKQLPTLTHNILHTHIQMDPLKLHNYKLLAKQSYEVVYITNDTSC